MSISQEQPWVIWQNEHLMAVHKPRGMLVHDGDTSLDEYVRRMLVSSLPASISFVPGPLHRLDRNTSGIIMFSKSLRGADIFSTALRFHQLQNFIAQFLLENSFSPLHSAIFLSEIRNRGAPR